MSAWVKACDCDVLGCVVNDMTVGVDRPADSDALRLRATFHGGPCCPKCHKPWHRKSAHKPGRE